MATEQCLLASVIMNDFKKLGSSTYSGDEDRYLSDWLPNFLIAIPPQYPEELRQELTSIAHEACDSPEIWDTCDINTLTVLFTSPTLTETYTHLCSLLQQDEWPEFIREVLINPYIFPERYKWEKIVTDNDATDLAYIAELAYELRVTLACFGAEEYGPWKAINELVASTDLEKTLLKLTSLSTACEWPSAEYNALYNDTSPTTFGDSEDTKDGERILVYSKGKNGKTAVQLNHPRFPGYMDTKEIFRSRSWKDANKNNKQFSPKNSEFFITSKSQQISTFEQLNLSPGYPSKEQKAEHYRYLVSLLWEMDKFSTRTGRPMRTWTNGSKHLAELGQPIWLDPKHCAPILRALYRITNNDEELLRHIRRLITTPTSK